MPAATGSSFSALPPRREVWWTWGLGLGVALLGLALRVAVSLAPVDPHTVTAAFPPTWGAERSFLVAAGEGEIVGVAPLPFLVTVSDTQPDLARRLRAAGAIAILHPSLVRLCGSRPRS